MLKQRAALIPSSCCELLSANGKLTNEGALKMSQEHEYNTFVFKGAMSKTENPFHAKYCGMESVAWCKGQALEHKDKLEDFIRELACGNIENPEEAAQELMDKMNWG